MKKLIIKLTIVIIATFNLQSCKPDKGCEYPDEYYYLTDDEKNKIPYPKGKDTLVFVSNAGDTAVLFSNGQQNGYEAVKLFGRADCNIGFAYYEKIEINYLGGDTILNNIKYYIYRNKYNESKIQLKYGIISTTEFPLSYVNNEMKYLDSATVNGNTIYGLTLGGNAIFNFQFGIFKINNLNGKMWILIP